ncbi:MAG: hypothetical protein AAF518_17590 [Spirochaetota bacterium]
MQHILVLAVSLYATSCMSTKSFRQKEVGHFKRMYAQKPQGLIRLSEHKITKKHCAERFPSMTIAIQKILNEYPKATGVEDVEISKETDFLNIPDTSCYRVSGYPVTKKEEK